MPEIDDERVQILFEDGLLEHSRDWVVQHQIIQELRELGETTILLEGDYAEWARNWLVSQRWEFEEAVVPPSVVLKVLEG